MTPDAARTWVTEAVVAACDGSLTADVVSAETESLTALGVTSLAYLRLIDMVESEFGVYIDLDASVPNTVDELVARLGDEGVEFDAA
jgi:acyl carrier protein